MTHDLNTLVRAIHAARELGVIVADDGGAIEVSNPVDNDVRELAEKEIAIRLRDYHFPRQQNEAVRLKRLAKRVNKK